YLPSCPPRRSPYRRARRRRTLLERPARIGCRGAPVVGEQPRLDDRDRPSPAVRGCELEALAVAVDRFGEPFPGGAGIAVHELRQACPRSSVPHACELALAGILILGRRQ